MDVSVDIFPSLLLSPPLHPFSLNFNLYSLCHFTYGLQTPIIVWLRIFIEFEMVGGLEVFCTSSFTLNPPLTLRGYLFPTLLSHISSLSSPTIYYPTSFNVFSTTIISWLLLLFRITIKKLRSVNERIHEAFIFAVCVF